MVKSRFNVEQMSNTICRHLCNSRTELLNYCALGNGMKTNLTSQPYNFQETDRERTWCVRYRMNPEELCGWNLKVVNPRQNLSFFAVSSICIFSLMANNPFFFSSPCLDSSERFLLPRTERDFLLGAKSAWPLKVLSEHNYMQSNTCQGGKTAHHKLV